MTQIPGHRVAAAALACIAIVAPSMPGRTEGPCSPIYGVTIPPGYRQWEMIAPSHEAGLDELRVILGNPMAIGVFRDAVLPFLDGTILVKLAWKHVPLAGIDRAYLPERATTVQVMVKDSKRYLDTGGLGFGRFINSEPMDEAQHRTCFACHEANVDGHDYVLTRHAP